MKCWTSIFFSLPGFDLLVYSAADRENLSEMDRPHLSMGQAVKHPLRFTTALSTGCNYAIPDRLSALPTCYQQATQNDYEWAVT